MKAPTLRSLCRASQGRVLCLAPQSREGEPPWQAAEFIGVEGESEFGTLFLGDARFRVCKSERERGCVGQVFQLLAFGLSLELGFELPV